MRKQDLKQAMIDAKWDRVSRRRESVRAIIGVGLIVLVVAVVIVGYGLIRNL